MARHSARPRFPRPPRPPRPADLSPELQQRWRELLDHHDGLAEREPRDLLGVRADASLADVQHAFAEQVKRFHPDRLPAELAVLRPYAARILVALNAARESLCRQAARDQAAQNRATPKAQPSEQPKPRGLPEVRAAKAAELHEQARAFAERRQFGRALAAIIHARVLDPGCARYTALHAWWSYEREEQPATPSGETLDLLARALQQDERCAEAHLYLGIVLERAGQVEQSIEHLRRALAIEPSNPRAIDALAAALAKTAVPRGLLQRLRAFLRR